MRDPHVPSVALALVVTAVLTACDMQFGLGTAPLDRELRGRYDGSFRVGWEDRRGGGRDGGPGVIRLDRAFGSSFGGWWEWRLGARRLRGEVRRGRADGFGRVSFELRTDFGRDLLEDLTDCRFVSGARRFTGETKRRGELRAWRTARLRCRDAFTGRAEDVRVRVSFAGWR